MKRKSKVTKRGGMAKAIHRTRDSKATIAATIPSLPPNVLRLRARSASEESTDGSTAPHARNGPISDAAPSPPPFDGGHGSGRVEHPQARHHVATAETSEMKPTSSPASSVAKSHQRTLNDQRLHQARDFLRDPAPLDAQDFAKRHEAIQAFLLDLESEEEDFDEGLFDDVQSWLHIRSPRLCRDFALDRRWGVQPSENGLGDTMHSLAERGEAATSPTAVNSTTLSPVGESKKTWKSTQIKRINSSNKQGVEVIEKSTIIPATDLETIKKDINKKWQDRFDDLKAEQKRNPEKYPDSSGEMPLRYLAQLVKGDKDVPSFDESWRFLKKQIDQEIREAATEAGLEDGLEQEVVKDPSPEARDQSIHFSDSQDDSVSLSSGSQVSEGDHTQDNTQVGQGQLMPQQMVDFDITRDAHLLEVVTPQLDQMQDVQQIGQGKLMPQNMIDFEIARDAYLLEDVAETVAEKDGDGLEGNVTDDEDVDEMSFEDDRTDTYRHKFLFGETKHLQAMMSDQIERDLIEGNMDDDEKGDTNGFEATVPMSVKFALPKPPQSAVDKVQEHLTSMIAETGYVMAPAVPERRSGSDFEEGLNEVDYGDYVGKLWEDDLVYDQEGHGDSSAGVFDQQSEGTLPLMSGALQDVSVGV